VRREAPHMKVKRLNLPYKQMLRLRRTVPSCFLLKFNLKFIKIINKFQIGDENRNFSK
jgi:hypothetical protein